jgi:hypothetical protein
LTRSHRVAEKCRLPASQLPRSTATRAKSADCSSPSSSGSARRTICTRRMPGPINGQRRRCISPTISRRAGCSQSIERTSHPPLLPASAGARETAPNVSGQGRQPGNIPCRDLARPPDA